MIRRLFSRFRRRPMTLDERLAERERRRAEYFERLRRADPLP